MTIELIIVLIVSILVVGVAISYLLQNSKDENKSQDYTPPAYSSEELDNIKLAEELYNKDLRPAIARKAKTKVTKQITPQVVEKVVELAKVFPDDAAINLEAVKNVKESKPEFPIDKPAKKKKKYYPKNN